MHKFVSLKDIETAYYLNNTTSNRSSNNKINHGYVFNQLAAEPFFKRVLDALNEQYKLVFLFDDDKSILIRALIDVLGLEKDCWNSTFICQVRDTTFF